MKSMKRVVGVCLLLSLALMVRCGNEDAVNGSDPVITGMNPNQVSIGQQNAVGTISGTNLNATAVSLGDGISVTTFNVKSAAEIEVRFNVSANTSAGARAVALTTSTGEIRSDAALTILDNRAPNAEFRITPRNGSLATVFELSAGNSTDPEQVRNLDYNWDFSDGSKATGKTVKHRFKDVGTHTVQLTITDSKGAYDISTKSVDVLKNSPPVARFVVRPGLSGNTNTEFKFDASSSSDADGKISDYIWDFNDGTKRRGQIVEHEFKKEGTHTVGLTVRDYKGNSDSTHKDIKVEKSTEVACQGNGSSHPLFIRGTVVAVEPDNWAIVDFGSGASCKTVWHKCDDFRAWGQEGLKEFFGIVDKMTDRGNGILAVHNKCPHRWPPAIGEEVFVYWKTCGINYCPGS